MPRKCYSESPVPFKGTFNKESTKVASKALSASPLLAVPTLKGFYDLNIFY